MGLTQLPKPLLTLSRPGVSSAASYMVSSAALNPVVLNGRDHPLGKRTAPPMPVHNSHAQQATCRLSSEDGTHDAPTKHSVRRQPSRPARMSRTTHAACSSSARAVMCRVTGNPSHVLSDEMQEAPHPRPQQAGTARIVNDRPAQMPRRNVTIGLGWRVYHTVFHNDTISALEGSVRSTLTCLCPVGNMLPSWRRRLLSVEPAGPSRAALTKLCPCRASRWPRSSPQASDHRRFTKPAVCLNALIAAFMTRPGHGHAPRRRY
ncbi:hypothetical protein BD311DRAFT_168184 [Dichomitus squalens]|uniref:Uncharacterized protein n=1 Tax=Dichomitus squalens TaxID=114155 RepID=A0A4Q9M6V6_9APHY|nr:hypothetical protein BD311DRAFT_251009 [Dichomitus squalens]TBU22067.1 hypothetical protein BD311DRAFT_168184 [Dichomitus squalens]